MSRNFFTAQQIMQASQGEMPKSVGGFNKAVAKLGWRHDGSKARKQSGREGGGGWEYHISLLPSSMQSRLLIAHGSASNKNDDKTILNRDAIWLNYEKLSADHKEQCAARLACLVEVAALRELGMTVSAAQRQVAKERHVAVATISNWKAMVRGKKRADWLAALAPNYGGQSRRSECHPEAYDVLKSDFLRYEGPTFTSCYRRVKRAAKTHGWSPIPSERALRRHLDADVPRAVQIMARETKEVAKTLYPAQRRTRDHLHAMEAVNMDGHKFDVFVKLPDQDKPTRMILIALQDLYSNKFVAWRLAETENKESVRLVIGDMVERYGIPDRISLDNGRAFTSKSISGGAKTRFRYKIRDEDPNGLLVALGVEIHWTTPYSGQSKPIERAFRDLADTIAKHPVCAGAYVGNKPDAKPENYGSKAVELDVFKKLVDQEIHAHNTREGRTTPIAKGRSFAQVFADSIAEPTTIVRWPTLAQKSLWLMAAERIRTKKSNGEISLYDNRYWCEALTAYAGQKVTVRFDPQKLFAGVKIYDAEDRLIAEAPCIDDSGFHDVAAANVQARTRNNYMKVLREQKRLHARLSAEALSQIYAAGDIETETSNQPIRSKVTRIATTGRAGNLALAVSEDAEETGWSQSSEDAFARSLQLIKGGLDEP